MQKKLAFSCLNFFLSLVALSIYEKPCTLNVRIFETLNIIVTDLTKTRSFLGRKVALHSFCAVSIIFLLAAACSPGITSIIVSLTFAGFGMGGYDVMYSYATEIVGCSKRSTACFFMFISVALGAFLGSVLALVTIPYPEVTWRGYIGIIAGMHFVAFFLLCYCPETPRYLLVSDKTEKAIEVSLLHMTRLLNVFNCVLGNLILCQRLVNLVTVSPHQAAKLTVDTFFVAVALENICRNKMFLKFEVIFTDDFCLNFRPFSEKFWLPCFRRFQRKSRAIRQKKLLRSFPVAILL